MKYPKGREFCAQLRARTKLALDAMRSELRKGNGIRAACGALEVSRTTVYNHAAEWPALARMLAKYAMDLDGISAAGVAARE